MMEPQKEALQDMVPAKKHLLRHQPANAQMGLINENTFCTMLQPRLFTMDLNVVEHKIAALNALAACNYLPQSRKKIIAVLFKALNSTNSELQEAGKACTKKFLKGATIKVDQIHTHMRPLLMMLGDYRSLTLNVVNRLTSQYNICSFVVLRCPPYLMVPVSVSTYWYDIYGIAVVQQLQDLMRSRRFLGLFILGISTNNSNYLCHCGSDIIDSTGTCCSMSQ